MATTTTNFGWDIPQSTDLVKDGATAIAALGQDIDTAFVDLKGGSTFQILAKNSNSDLDFVWVTNDQGDITAVTAGTGISGGGSAGDVTITNSMATAIDAKGDLIAGTAADSFSRLAVGTNGQVLTADSSAATGLAWSTASGGSTNVAGKNVVLNSNFSIWQRGTSGTANSFAAGAGYNADRWQNYSANSLTVSRQVTNDTTNLPNLQYCARVQRNSGQTSTSQVYHAQTVETLNSVPYAGKTLTFSFYARSGANFSAASSALTFEVGTGTGTDESVFAFTGRATPITSTATLTTTWQRFSATGTIASTAKELGIAFLYTPSGTAGTNDWFEVTGVQLEIAGSASAYSPNTSTYALELAACQRYFNRFNGGVSLYYSNGMSDSGTTAYGVFSYPVIMRVVPSFAITGTASSFSVYNSGGAITCSAVPGFTNAGVASAVLINTVASGLTAGRAVMLTAGTGTTLDFSAEL